MPRKPKPYFRKQTKSWYFSTKGKQVPLGKDREAAFEKFHKLMANQTKVVNEVQTLYGLSQVYLDWIEENRKKGTYDQLKHYLESFIESVGRSTKVAALRKHHMTTWTNKDSWNSTSRNDAIGCVQRMLNWGADQEYIESNPIASMKKPKRKRREVVYTADQWKAIKSHATGSLIDFLDFLWSTGCRPKEARTIEARHVHEDLVIFPPDESKGERDSRVIFMDKRSKQIVDRLVKKYPTGVLFRNSRGIAWTKDAVVQRLTRISEKSGFRVIAYGARHSYATNSLIKNVDSISLAHLMGHRDTSQISRTYSHLAQNIEHLRSIAKSASQT